MVRQAMLKVAGWIDALNEGVGRILILLLPFVILVAACVVVLRYVFHIGFPWMTETFIWLNGLIVALGSGYVLKDEKHVRVDVLFKDFSPRGKALVNALGVLILLWPALYVLSQFAWPFAMRSIRMGEASPTAGGLPAIYVLKGSVLAFCLLCGLQGLALLLRSLDTMIHGSNKSGVHV